MTVLSRKIERALLEIEARFAREHERSQPRCLTFESEAALEAARERGEVPPGAKVYLGVRWADV